VGGPGTFAAHAKNWADRPAKQLPPPTKNDSEWTAPHTLDPRAVWTITRNLAVADKSRDAVQYAMVWLTPLEHALPRVCYYAELGRSTSRGVKTNRGEPKIGERLAAPPWDRGVPTVVKVRGRAQPPAPIW